MSLSRPPLSLEMKQMIFCIENHHPSDPPLNLFNNQEKYFFIIMVYTQFQDNDFVHFFLLKPQQYIVFPACI